MNADPGRRAPKGAHIDEIYARHTGQALERVHEDMDRDHYFTAEQAREYGLVDRVIASHELARVPTGFGARGTETISTTA